LGSLYNTAAGVGIHDRVSADVGERRKGIHWLVPVCGIPVLVLSIVKFVPHGVASFFNPMKHGAAVALQRTNAVAPVAIASSSVSLPPENHVREVRSVETNEVVTMVGYSVTPIIYDGVVHAEKRITVQLSDGRRYRSGDGHLQYLGPDYCVVDGRTNHFVPRVEQPSITAADSPQFAMAAPVVSVPQVPAEVSSGGGSTLYVIPYHRNSMARPGVRDVVSGGGFSQGSSQSY